MRPDNRSALLAGARRCLDRRGYARTTAREVAGESGVSLAAIGYHFGTTDTLLVTALLEGLGEWSEGLDARLDAQADQADPSGPGAAWDAVIDSLDGYRGVLAASYELIARSDDSPQVAERLRAAVDGARRELAGRLTDGDSATAGFAAYAALSGLVVQWLVDPASVPSGEEVADGLADLAARGPRPGA